MKIFNKKLFLISFMSLNLMTTSLLVNVPAYAMYSYITEDNDVHIQNGIHCKLCENDTYMVVGLDDGIEKIAVPEKINGKVISRINSIHSCSLKEIQIPDTVTDIDENAFRGCRSLDKVALPKNLQEIKEGVFSSCFRLRQVELPKELKTISTNAFLSCNLLESILIPESVSSISKDAFKYCHLLRDFSIDDKNKNYKISENGSLYDLRTNEIIININKEFLSEKERQADFVYNEFKKLTPRDNSLTTLEENINAFMQNYGGGKPKVISEADFENYISTKNKKLLFRGIVGAQYCDMLKYSNTAYFPDGFNGQAIYTTDNLSYAKQYATEEDSHIARMVVADETKVTNDLELDIIKNIIVSKHYEEFPESKAIVFGDLPDNINRHLINNYGLIAAILGFDAIDNLNGSDEFFWIGTEFAILNRSKLIICDKDIDVK